MTQNSIKRNGEYGGWFRMYNHVIDDPKIQLLSPEQFKAWVNILCIASQNKGELPDIQDIAFRLRMDIQHTSSIYEKLLSDGLIDYDSKSKKTSPHNWKIRQPKRDKSRDRMRRLRAKKKTGDDSVACCDASRDANVPTSTSTSSNNCKGITGGDVSDNAIRKEKSLLREGRNQ